MSGFTFGQLVEICENHPTDEIGVMFAGSYGMVIRAALPGDTFPDGGKLGPLSDEVYMVSVGADAVFYHQDYLKVPSIKSERKECKKKKAST